MSSIDRFLEKLRASLTAGTFVKLTLSGWRGAGAGPRNIYGRIVELREGRAFSLLLRHATRDVTKNIPIAEAADFVRARLGAEFGHAHLFTTAGDWRLRFDATGDGVLKAAKPVFISVPEPEHDRRKVKALAAAPFLAALGVTNADGIARPGMADKLRQIERFTELLGHLIADSPLRDRSELRVLDLGSGKGYLTFAAHEFFRLRGVAVKVTGVEVRDDLVQFTNRVARELNCDGLRFVCGAIGEFAPDAPPDVLIALHACDTATDDALALGIRAGAQLIVAAPCCHKELRVQLAPPAVLRDVLRHGILAEREAESLTDGIRALLLEIHGYKASVFEFIAPEHTGKNLMISAQRREVPTDAEPLRKRLRELCDFFAVREQRLARLLGEL